jgi:hypothetical protein
MPILKKNREMAPPLLMRNHMDGKEFFGDAKHWCSLASAMRGYRT